MGEQRGQLVLIAALGLAVVFVALALLLNTVIYAENLATRGADVGGSDAISYQVAAESGAAGAVARANEYNYSTYDEAVSRVRADVARWSGDAGTYEALDAAAASTTLVNVTNGTTITQNATRPFTDDDGTVDWTLATDVTGARRFELNVSRASLANPEDSDENDLDELREDEEGVFRVNVTNGTHEYEVFIYRTGSGEVTVSTANASDVFVGTCTAAGDHVTVDLTEGEVAGTECSALGLPGVEGEFDVEYRNGDAIEGTYQVVVDRSTGELDLTPYDGPGNPDAVPAVYNVTLTVRVSTPDLSYEGNVTAAPTDGVGGPGVEP